MDHPYDLSTFESDVKSGPNWDIFFTRMSEETPAESQRTRFFREMREARTGNPAAQFRLRQKRQIAIDNRLVALGSLALIAVGNLMTILTPDGKLERFVRLSHWRETFVESSMFRRLTESGKHGFYGTRYADYKRLENAIRSFGQMICLSVRDLEERELIVAFDKFKVWAVDNSFSNGRVRLDETINHIKYLSKVAQAVFLRTKVPNSPGGTPTRNMLLPFVGQLKFIADMAIDGRRTRELTAHEARACAQIANTSRALPYPSTDQIVVSVKETVETFTSTFRPHPKTLAHYKLGLTGLVTALPEQEVAKETHVSLVSKGVEENPRSKGGRSNYLVRAARKTTDRIFLDELVEIERLVGKLDVFGQVILDKYTFALAKELLGKKKYSRPATLGDLLYVEPDVLVETLDRALNKQRYVPPGLPHILNQTAAKMMLEVGHYSQEPELICSFITFTKQVKYTLDKTLPVRADVSVEAGMKGRLTTCAMAGFAHLSQMPSNNMRGILSRDPFFRVGFQEADKLWETLKAYRKANEKSESKA